MTEVVALLKEKASALPKKSGRNRTGAGLIIKFVRSRFAGKVITDELSRFGASAQTGREV